MLASRNHRRAAAAIFLATSAASSLASAQVVPDEDAPLKPPTFAQPPPPPPAPPNVPAPGLVPAPSQRYEPSPKPWSFIPSGHAAYGIGGGLGLDSGFRQSLDIALGIGFDQHDSPWTLQASLVTGFGKYPTYASLDLGKVEFAGHGPYGGLAGVMVSVGPALRLDPNVSPGGELSLRVYLLFAQLGARVIVIPGTGGDSQIEATFGVGLF
jgi:hypothetical protein